MSKASAGSSYTPLLIVAFLAVLSAALLAEVFDRDAAQRTFDQDLYNYYKEREVRSLADLVEDFDWQQTQWMPIAPPDPDLSGWAQDAEPSLLPFDPTTFPKEFLAGLTPAYRDGVLVYPVTGWEDPATRKRVFVNAEGREIAAAAAPADYDPRWCLLDRYSDLDLRGWSADYLDWVTRVYDPSRIHIRYQLILEDDLVKWVAVQSVWAALHQAQAAELAAEGGGMMLMRLPAADSNIVFQAITRETNGVKLEIGYPDDFTNRLEIFTCTDLVAFAWTLTATNLPTAGTNTIWWTDTDTNQAGRFYAAGNADIDSDGDGLKDAREKYLHHTSMTNRDSDADGLVDGYSGVVSTNTYPGGAHTNGGAYVEGELTWGTNPQLFDTDGDGMGDGWEVANGHDPLNPNDPPNVCGTIFYSGRQTGTVWVIAVTSSNSWSTNCSKTLSAPGAYQIPNLPGTSYWLKAWMDTSADAATNATEAWGGCTNNPALVTNQVTGKNITLVDPDNDSDGVPDWWEVKYFGSTTNYNGTSDPDGDQYTNIEEYQADTDPTNALSHPWNISGTITYTGPQTGTIYVIACTAETSWAAAQYTTLNAPGAYTITHLPPNTNYWIRSWRDSTSGGTNDFWEAWGEYGGNPIYLDTNVTGVAIALADPDSDGDTLPDWWEVKYGLDPFNGARSAAAGWWAMDETAGTNVSDSTGNGNTGTICNSSGAWTNGQLGNALAFDGADDYVQLRDSDTLKPQYASVVAWIKPSQTYSNGSAVFFSKKPSGASTGYALGYDQGALSFLICASGSKALTHPCTLSSGVWCHVAGTYDGPNHRLYVNGQLVASTNYSWGTSMGYIDQGTNDPRIAAAPDATASNWFAGVMDDVAVFDGGLASNQVHAIYELGADLDTDGFSNYTEYGARTDPNNGDTNPPTVLITYPPNGSQWRVLP